MGPPHPALSVKGQEGGSSPPLHPRPVCAPGWHPAVLCGCAQWGLASQEAGGSEVQAAVNSQGGPVSASEQEGAWHDSVPIPTGLRESCRDGHLLCLGTSQPWSRSGGGSRQESGFPGGHGYGARQVPRWVKETLPPPPKSQAPESSGLLGSEKSAVELLSPPSLPAGQALGRCPCRWWDLWVRGDHL